MRLQLYRMMYLIRRTEEILMAEYHPADEMRCPMHFCVGQEAMPAALHGIAEARQVFAVLAQLVYLMVEAVDVFPELSRDAVANGARVFANLCNTLRNGTGILRAEGQELENFARRSLLVSRVESLLFSGYRDQRIPAQPAVDLG